MVPFLALSLSSGFSSGLQGVVPAVISTAVVLSVISVVAVRSLPSSIGPVVPFLAQLLTSKFSSGSLRVVLAAISIALG